MASSGNLNSVTNILSNANMDTTVTRRKNKLDRYEERLKNHEDQKDVLKRVINELKSATYQIGDVVVHPKYGVCLVYSITVPTEKYDDDLRISSMAVPTDEVVYEINNAEYSCVIVTEKEISPYTSASKTLYGKSKT